MERAISVVIPTYQRARLVVEAIRSAADQSLTPLEIVVVDDGSTDGTADAVRRLEEELRARTDVRLVQRPKEGGNAARNAGVRAARGAWIAFLDSDDVWSPEKLELQLARLQDDASAVACYCGVRELDEHGSLPAEPRAYPEGDLSRRLLVRDVTGPTSCHVVRRDALLEAGLFDEALEARQDWDMWIRISRLGPILSVGQPLTGLRRHGGPRTATDPTREVAAYRRIRAKYREELRSLPWAMRCSALSAYHRRLARVRRHHEGRWARGLAHALAAWATSPLLPENTLVVAGFFLPDGIRRRLRPAWNRLAGRSGLGLTSH